MDEFGFHKDDKYVDIHGREIPTMTIGPEEEPACLLSDLKRTGVAIIQRTQYAKLASISKEFDSDFVDYMLESAKSFMLANKCSFNDQQITRSIEYCKQELGCAEVSLNKTFKGREIEENVENFVIRVANKQSTPKSNPQIKSPHVKTRQNDEFNSSFKNINTQLRTPKSRPSYNSPHDPGTNQKEVKNFKKNSPKVPQDQKTSDVAKPFRKFNYTFEQEENEVLVTAIDKPNCVWVRDVKNQELLQKIHRKVNHEAEFQDVAKKPWVMDKVYMAQDEGNWFRCKIVRFSPLTVFFLDYGNVCEVDEIRYISEELGNTPCLAVRITFKAPSYRPQLEDVLCIKRFHKNDDGTLFVNILKKLSGVTTSVVHEKPFFETKSVNQVKEEPVILKKPEFFCELKHDQRVAIGYVKNNEFFLRTKECLEKEREIDHRSQISGKTAQKIKGVKVGQVVLYEDPTEKKFYRGLVKKFYKKKVDIEFMDSGREESVDLFTLQTIDERLGREPRTFISGGKLEGFENEPLSENCKNFINDCIERRVKFSVVLGFDDELDLHDGTQLISQQLRNLSPKRLFLNDMKTFTPEIDIKPYSVGCYKEPENLTLVPSEMLQSNIDKILMSDFDSTPYPPVAEEVCRCFYFDSWYRCVVTRVGANECEVLLLDFGKITGVEKKLMRKPEEDFTDLPVLAIPCVLTDLPNHKEIRTLLRNKIIEGEVYNVNVKKIEGGKWHVELPMVYNEIREMI